MKDYSGNIILISFFFSIIALAVVLFIHFKFGPLDLGIFFLNKLNKRAKNNLNDYNYNRFIDIRDYFLTSSLSYRTIENILTDVLSLIEDAQNEGKSIDCVLGNDHEKFCNDILKEYEGNFKKYYKILIYFKNSIITIIQLIFILVIAKSIYKWNFIYGLKHSISYMDIIYIVYCLIFVGMYDYKNHNKTVFQHDEDVTSKQENSHILNWIVCSSAYCVFMVLLMHFVKRAASMKLDPYFCYIPVDFILIMTAVAAVICLPMIIYKTCYVKKI